MAKIPFPSVGGRGGGGEEVDVVGIHIIRILQPFLCFFLSLGFIYYFFIYFLFSIYFF